MLTRTFRGPGSQWHVMLKDTSRNGTIVSIRSTDWECLIERSQQVDGHQINNQQETFLHSGNILTFAQKYSELGSSTCWHQLLTSLRIRIFRFQTLAKRERTEIASRIQTRLTATRCWIFRGSIPGSSHHSRQVLRGEIHRRIIGVSRL